MNYLEQILQRKAREVSRRLLHAGGGAVRVSAGTGVEGGVVPRGNPGAFEALRRVRSGDVLPGLVESRGGAGSQGLAGAGQEKGGRDARLPLRVLGEVKFRSPSKGALRPWSAGEGVRLARAYERAGVHCISVLADYPGFGGSPLQVRRVSQAVHVPVLFKEFVLHPVQIELARAVGASMVLLLVRALDDALLHELCDAAFAAGLEPVVEAADEKELVRATKSAARIIGINARDLSTFHVDPLLAARCVAAVPADRVCIWMSGVTDAASFRRVADSRADAVLIGEGLMRSADPRATLATWQEKGA